MRVYSRSWVAGASFLPVLLLIASSFTPVAQTAPESRDVTAAPGPVSAASDDLKARLASLGRPDYVEAGTRGRDRWKAVHRFYESVGYRAAWVSGGRLTRQAESLLRAALQADRDGMDVAPYARLASEARGIRRASGRDWADPAVDLDIRVTYALARYADEMANGRVDARGKTALWSLPAMSMTS